MRRSIAVVRRQSCAASLSPVRIRTRMGGAPGVGCAARINNQKMLNATRQLIVEDNSR